MKEKKGQGQLLTIRTGNAFLVTQKQHHHAILIPSSFLSFCVPLFLNSNYNTIYRTKDKAFFVLNQS